MTVPVTEIKRFDNSRASGHRVVDYVRSDLGERRLTVVLPHPI